MNLSKELKISIIVILSISLSIWGFMFLKGKNIFNNSYDLYAIYPKIDGLIEASPVLVKGFKVGQVSKITLIKKDNEYKILVKILIKSKEVLVPKKTLAKAFSADIMGTKAVELIFSDETEFFKANDTLDTSTEESLKASFNKQLAPLQAKAMSLLSSIDSVMLVIQTVLNSKTQSNLTNTFDNITITFKSVANSAKKLESILDAEQKNIKSTLENMHSTSVMLQQNNSKIASTIVNLSAISDSLAKSNLKQTIKQMHLSFTEFNSILTQINSGKGSLGKFLKNDSLYTNLNKASESLNNVLVDLKSDPRNYVHFSIFGKKSKKLQK